MEGRDTETTEGTANSCRSLKKAGRLQRRIPKNAKHAMKVEIEKVVKAQKEVQSAAEITDREEQVAHNKESKTTSSTRRTRRNTSRKWKLNSRISVMTSSLSWTRTSSHRPRRITGAEGHQQSTPKRSSSLSKSFFSTSRREATSLRCSQERHESCEAEWSIQEHTAQRKVVAVEEQQKLVKNIPGDSSRREKRCRDKEQGSDGEQLIGGDEEQHHADTGDECQWIQR